MGNTEELLIPKLGFWTAKNQAGDLALGIFMMLATHTIVALSIFVIGQANKLHFPPLSQYGWALVYYLISLTFFQFIYGPFILFILLFLRRYKMMLGVCAVMSFTLVIGAAIMGFSLTFLHPKD